MTSSQPFVLDDVKMLLAMLNSAPKPDVPDVEATRQGYRALKAMTEPEPRRLEVIRDLVCPGPAGDCRKSGCPGKTSQEVTVRSQLVP